MLNNSVVNLCFVFVFVFLSLVHLWLERVSFGEPILRVWSGLPAHPTCQATEKVLEQVSSPSQASPPRSCALGLSGKSASVSQRGKLGLHKLKAAAAKIPGSEWEVNWNRKPIPRKTEQEVERERQSPNNTGQGLGPRLHWGLLYPRLIIWANMSSLT